MEIDKCPPIPIKQHPSVLKGEATRITVTATWILCILGKTLEYKSISVDTSVSLRMIITEAFRNTIAG